MFGFQLRVDLVLPAGDLVKSLSLRNLISHNKEVATMLGGSSFMVDQTKPSSFFLESKKLALAGVAQWIACGLQTKESLV